MPADEQLIALLQDRDGRPTTATLRDGRSVTVHNIAWGYDEGDDWAHITTNISPSIDGAAVDFFFSSEVSELRDPDTGVHLFDG